MNGSDFWKVILDAGFYFFSGVPCSILKPVLNNIPQSVSYIPATREDSALGVASGACLVGRKAGILIQNSGLGNITNALTSFNLVYKIPILLIITWRGEPGKPDAPEHEVMGKVMLPILDILGIPYEIIGEKFEEQVQWAKSLMEKDKKPVALVLKDGVVK